jgi:acyl-homoserine lactone synthase
MMEAFTGKDEARFPRLFRRMFEQRYDIYVKRRKWKGLPASDGLERDQFDNEHAIYLMALDEDDEICASLRLLPTTRPHIFGDLFPHLAGVEPVPRGEDILELTRFYVAPFGADRRTRDWLVGVLCSGMLEYSLEHGVTRITSVIDTFLLKLMLSMEWRVRPLGLPQRYPEGEAIGVVVDVDERALESTRRTKDVQGPVLCGGSLAVPRLPRMRELTRQSPGAVN